MNLTYLSVCSGLEGATLAWEPLGFVPVGFAEIEPFPCALLAERYGSNLPGEPLSRNAPPNFGDMTAIDLDRVGDVDILIGGTPCQGFSIAGKRLSLDDDRSNLALAYVVLAHELARSHGLRNAVWENVPGVFSMPDNAFGCFISALVGHDKPFPKPKGAGWPSAGMADGPRGRLAWRVLDAQYFGLAQRRERVFVVSDFGNGADPAEVLFERQGLSGNSAPSREARQGVAGTLKASLGKRCGSFDGVDEHDSLIASDVSRCVTTRGGQRQDLETETIIAHALRADGFDASEDGTGRGTPIVAEVADTLTAHWESSKGAKAGSSVGLLNPIIEAQAFDLRGREDGAQFEGPHDTANMRAASGGSSRSYVASQWAVRRLTPRECERLQGVPDDYTLVNYRGKPVADGPRYKALGNSWAVPVVRWIGERLQSSIPALVSR